MLANSLPLLHQGTLVACLLLGKAYLPSFSSPLSISTIGQLIADNENVLHAYPDKKKQATRTHSNMKLQHVTDLHDLIN